MLGRDGSAVKATATLVLVVVVMMMVAEAVAAAAAFIITQKTAAGCATFASPLYHCYSLCVRDFELGFLFSSDLFYRFYDVKKKG